MLIFAAFFQVDKSDAVFFPKVFSLNFLVLLFFVWNHIQIAMEKQDCYPEILGFSVSSTDGFQFLNRTV